MKDQHRKITGYRDLSQSEIDDMNRIKRLGGDLGELINEIEKKNGIDRRWLNIAKSESRLKILPDGTGGVGGDGLLDEAHAFEAVIYSG